MSQMYSPSRKKKCCKINILSSNKQQGKSWPGMLVLLTGLTCGSCAERHPLLRPEVAASLHQVQTLPVQQDELPPAPPSAEQVEQALQARARAAAVQPTAGQPATKPPVAEPPAV
ncbi:MAG: hypothetical protein FJ125_14830, partial [Deltaproteobacteria bacterium]|nr:hypothetical protein [Deltaproteobacteria bacterium]